MLNPPRPEPKATLMTPVAEASKTIVRKVSRERDLVIAALFLVTGFLMGRI